MFTAAITAAVAAILNLFGIKPGPYLVVVAIVVKAAFIVVGVIATQRLLRKRAQVPAAPVTPPAPPEPPPSGPA